MSSDKVDICREDKSMGCMYCAQYCSAVQCTRMYVNITKKALTEDINLGNEGSKNTGVLLEDS